MRMKNMGPCFLRGRSAHLSVLPIVAWAGMVGALGTFVLGQAGPAGPVPARARLQAAGRTNPYAAVLQPSEEATTLLKRAQEGIDRADWKLAVDSLQRIVELPGEHVLTSDGKTYESARRHAHRRIAALPESGLRTYEVIHGGEAAALASRAIEKQDERALRSVVERYFCTQAGASATLTLADWLIDRGSFAQASALLRDLQTLAPAGRVDPGVNIRMAICMAGLGRSATAGELLAPQSQPSGKAPTSVPADRVEMIRQFAARASRKDAPKGSRAWPVTYGGLSRSNVMPPVEPALTNNLSWVRPLPFSELKYEVEALLGYSQRRGLLPVRQFVTDGRLLLVKGETELVAFDADSFTPVWTTKARSTAQARASGPQDLQAQLMWRVHAERQGQGGQEIDQQIENDPLARRLLYDAIGSGISIAFGSALTVDWGGEPPSVLPRAMRWQMPGAFPRDPFSTGQVNQIVAYSLQDGSVRWRCQPPATGEVPDGNPAAADAQFMSVPVPVGDELLSVCRSNSDLFAVLIDPENGKIRRQLYLCGTGGGAFDALSPLPPAIADGLVFIPTGRGLLVALDSANWSIRWAVRYEGATPDVQREGGWLPTPPVAVADVVLLAPDDADELICLDRSSGEIRWRVKRDAYTYLLGATDSHVWVAGPGVQMLDVRSGRPVWRRNAAEPTGRGALAGDRVYLPTLQGLKAFDASSGEPLQIDQPAAPLLLGNLLSWDGSLYSVSVLDVSCFPDLGRGYAQAVARHAENPADPGRAIRLASLELLRNQPEKARAALTSVAADLKDRDPQRHAQVAHLRVRSLLELARDPARADALSLLQEARASAATPADAIKSSLALGDLLLRNKNAADACRQYLSLILSTDGEEIIPEESGLERRARAMAAELLVRARRELTPEQQTELDKHVASWLAGVIERRDATAASWLAETPEIGRAGREALLLLARWAVEDLRFEQAESYLSRVLLLGDPPPLQAEAIARLAALYLQPDELHQPVSAARLLERLEREFATVDLPTDILAVEGKPAAGVPEPRLPAARVASVLRSRIDAKILASHQAALTPIQLGPLGAASTRMHQASRSLIPRGDRVEPLADIHLLLLDRNRVESHAAADGRLLWPAELKLLGDPAVEPQMAELNLQMQGTRGESGTRARGVLDGQTLILNTEYGLHAVGLLTGRRLWSRAYEPVEQGAGDPSGSDAWIWSHNGYIVSVDARRHLEVASAWQGDRILWRWTRPNRRWYAVRARGPYVVAVDAGLEHVDIFRLEDGRSLGECTFAQEPAAARKVNITLYDDVVCGPVSPKEVAARELATPGVERWRVPVPEGISQIFKPTPGLLAIGDRIGSVQVIDPATGKKLMESATEACSAGVVDGALVDGTLYVYGYETRAADVNEYDRQRLGIAAIRMDTGAVLWQQGNLGPRTFLTDELLRVSSNAIPVAAFLQGGSRELSGARADVTSTLNGGVELRLLDRRTGQLIGEKMIVPLTADSTARQIADVQVWPGQVMVVAGNSYIRFPSK